MKSLELQLKEAQEKLAAKDAELVEMRSTSGKVSVTQELRESGLPAVAQARLQKRFAGQSLAGLKVAIAEEKDYVRKVRGAAKTGSTTNTDTPTPKRDLVECYVRLGLSTKEAHLAAGDEDAVEEMKESQERLVSAAKSLGLTDTEALRFSEQRKTESW